MAPSRPKNQTKAPSENHWGNPEIRRQAWSLLVFSAFFAVLFNAFYPEGIELKFKPPKSFHLMDKLKNNGGIPDTSPGWKNPSPSRTHFPAAPTPTVDAIPRVSLVGVESRFEKKSCVFLDARKPEEYREGHIPGALNCFANELDRYLPLVIPQLPDKNREIIAYCHGGDCDLSLLAAKALIEAGYRQVGIFEGGWPDWKKSGYPITTGENP
jgi:rhodanese-related sulfurtransferase